MAKRKGTTTIVEETTVTISTDLFGLADIERDTSKQAAEAAVAPAPDSLFADVPAAPKILHQPAATNDSLFADTLIASSGPPASVPVAVPVVPAASPPSGEDSVSLAGSDLTNAFKVNIQELLKRELGVAVSKDKAWATFKAFISNIVGFTVRHGRVPLSGVGTFEILKAGARKSKIETHNFVPKFRFRAGSKIDEYLEKAVLGVKK